jgi:hypothetical protein
VLEIHELEDGWELLLGTYEMVFEVKVQEKEIPVARPRP